MINFNLDLGGKSWIIEHENHRFTTRRTNETLAI